MKPSCLLFYFLITIAFVACSTEKKKSVETNRTPITQNNSDSTELNKLIGDYDFNRRDSFYTGDVNGDGINDTAIVQPPLLFYHKGNMDSQYVNIIFSCPLPPIKHYDGFHGIVVNVSDLDGNKTDEILYMPDWYQSNDAMFYIYAFRRNRWEQLAQGAIRRDILRDQKDPLKFLRGRVKKINNKAFRITEHVLRETDWLDEERVVVIK